VPNFLVASIIVSLVLTIVANVVLWLFPGIGRRVGDSFERLAERQAGTYDGQFDERRRSRVHVFFPWKAMLIGSIVLTIALNLAIVLFD
jgi:hypothetical protein